MKNKFEAFKALVEKRKNDNDFPDGLLNPSQFAPEYDTAISLNPFDKWQNNLDAEILVVGQDWGDEKYFKDNKGLDRDDNPTCENLRKLIRLRTGIYVGPPSEGNKDSSLFFTNAIVGIKPTTHKGMSAPVKASWISHGVENYLRPLIDIIQPKYIVTLGQTSYSAIAHIYGLPKNVKMIDLVKNNPINTPNGIKIFSFFHCGGLGLRNRSKRSQLGDWRKLSDELYISEVYKKSELYQCTEDFLFDLMSGKIDASKFLPPGEYNKIIKGEYKS